MKRILCMAFAIITLSGGGPAAADSTPIVIDDLKFETVHGVAQRTILATDDAGKPLIALVKLANGTVLPPHGATGGLRILTVLSGDLSWGDGDKPATAAERVFSAGTVVVVPAEGGEHWAAARDGDVLLQVVFVRDGSLAPEALAESPGR